MYCLRSDEDEFLGHDEQLLIILHSPAYEDGTDSEFRNVGN